MKYSVLALMVLGGGAGCSAGRGDDPGEVPGAPVCDSSLPFLQGHAVMTVQGTEAVMHEVETGAPNDVYVLDSTHCRTYFKSNKYVIRIESVYASDGAFPGQVEAATIVGRRNEDQAFWSYDLAKKTRTIVVIGTDSDDLLRTDGFPYGISLGALVVGSTQTYAGGTADLLLPETANVDAERIRDIWARERPREAWTGDLLVLGHSAGSVPAERLVEIHGGEAYLYGTPRYSDVRLNKEGKAESSVLKYTIHVFNHEGDPVSGSYRCADAYVSCKGKLGRGDAKDPDTLSVACTVAKDAYCAEVGRELAFESWAPHDYSDMSVEDEG